MVCLAEHDGQVQIIKLLPDSLKQLLPGAFIQGALEADAETVSAALSSDVFQIQIVEHLLRHIAQNHIMNHLALHHIQGL